MKLHLARTATAAVAVAGALLLFPSAAQAAPAQRCGDITQTSAGNVGLLNGNQIALPIDLGLDVSHNALGILGIAGASGDDISGCYYDYDSGRRHHRHHHRHPAA